jgi:hypothetical protein
MPQQPEPVVLELAPLPREQMGPFLLLGLDKAADAEQIEAHWAQRVIWARKNQTGLALEDINWAREVLRDPDRRLHADLTSLNPDTLDGTVARLAQRYGAAGPTWKPLEAERPLRDYVPAADVPDAEAVRAAVALPEVPREVPAVATLLDRLTRPPLDPWALDLPLDPEPDELA